MPGLNSSHKRTYSRSYASEAFEREQLRARAIELNQEWNHLKAAARKAGPDERTGVTEKLRGAIIRVSNNAIHSAKCLG